MDIAVACRRPAEFEADALAINLFEDEKPVSGHLADLDSATGGTITRALELAGFKGKLNQTALISPVSGIGAPRLLIVGAGKQGKFGADQARMIAGIAVRHLGHQGATELAIWLHSDLDAAEQGRAVTEGAILGGFDPGQYKTKKEEDYREPELLTLVEPDPQQSEAVGVASRQGKIVGDAVNYARRLANEPGNKMPPSGLAEAAEALAKQGLQVEILDRAQMADRKMGAILGVAAGSEQPPFMISLRYNGAEDAPYLGFIGKGVTFDSGGISIKPSENMHLMKRDMAGAAAVLGAMLAIAQLQLKVNVLGVIPAVENMPSGHSYRPGDVLQAMNGKTIEVINTDAEGRIILADAMGYAQSLGATRLVDAATLTGAVVIALGYAATAAMGTPQEWVDQVMAAGKASGEKIWQLPLYDEYGEHIKSEIADVANSGGRPAGTITGALFIKSFVDDGVPWVHLDIAGTAWTEKATSYLAKGPTGVAVRTFIRLAESMQEPASSSGG